MWNRKDSVCTGYVGYTRDTDVYVTSQRAGARASCAAGGEGPGRPEHVRAQRAPVWSTRSPAAKVRKARQRCRTGSGAASAPARRSASLATECRRGHGGSEPEEGNPCGNRQHEFRRRGRSASSPGLPGLAESSSAVANSALAPRPCLYEHWPGHRQRNLPRAGVSCVNAGLRECHLAGTQCIIT